MITSQEDLGKIFCIICLICVLCAIISACIGRNKAEAAAKQECTVVSVSDVGSYSTSRIKCPEKNYRCFSYHASSYSSSISCVPMGM